MHLHSIHILLLLFVWLLGPMAAHSQQTNHSAANQRTTYYTKVQNEGQNFSEFSGFVYLFRKKASIPKDLLQKYVALSKLKGNFQAKGIHKLPNGVVVLVMEQKTSMCLRQHLLTTDGSRILFQRVVGEKCVPAPGAHSNEFMALEYQEGKGFMQVIYKDVFLPEKDREVLSKQLLKITSKGAIVPVSL